jgi:hypothetical protein
MPVPLWRDAGHDDGSSITIDSSRRQGNSHRLNHEIDFAPEIS